MEYARELFELFKDLSQQLDEYRAIHHGIFSTKWWRTLPIPGLFKPIPVVEYRAALVKIEAKLASKDRRLRTLRTNPYVPSAEKAYHASMHIFTHELQKSTAHLMVLTTRLCAKRENRPYSRTTYLAHLKAYQDSLPSLVAAAETLMHLYGEALLKQKAQELL